VIKTLKYFYLFLRDKPLSSLVIFLMMAIGPIVTIFPPDLDFFRQQSNFANQIMLAYFIWGFFFLILRRDGLMTFSFLCCAVIALFLKIKTGDPNEYTLENGGPKLRVAHLNVSYIEEGVQKLNTVLDKFNPDLVSIEELNPLDVKWMMENDSLKKKFPFRTLLYRDDLLCTGIFSSSAFYNIDTLKCNHSQALKVKVKLNEKFIQVTSIYLKESVNRKITLENRESLNCIGEDLKKSNQTEILIGDFHLVPWSNELTQLKNKIGLFDSRRGFNPTNGKVGISFLQVPMDHIFYSSSIDCTQFQTIREITGISAGIVADFQFNEAINDKKKNQ
jgi:endonuclease/exonuclease/phosphatase (EEP) superfamily protein YafD